MGASHGNAVIERYNSFSGVIRSVELQDRAYLYLQMICKEMMPSVWKGDAMCVEKHFVSRRKEWRSCVCYVQDGRDVKCFGARDVVEFVLHWSQK